MEGFVFDWWWTSHQSLAHKGLRILRFCIVSWKDTRKLPIKHCMGRQIDVVQVQQDTELWTELMASQWNSSGIFCQDSQRCSCATKSKSYCQDWVRHQRISQEGLSSCRCSTTSHGDQKTTRKNASQMLNSFLCKEIRSRTMVILRAWIWKKEVLYKCRYSPQGEWVKIAERMLLEFVESGHPVLRATSPLSRGVLKSKGGGQLLIHCCADLETIKTVFRTIISVNQFSLHGALAEMCEEYESCQDRTGGDPLWGTIEFFDRAKCVQDKHTFWMMILHKKCLLQRYRERIEKLSQQDRLSKFCTDAGFPTTVEVGQYFMTKDTEEFLQFTDSVACREYTLPRDEDSSEPRRLDRGNTKIGPVLEVTACCLQGKYGLEFRHKSENKDNSHSWVRISHGFNNLVTNLNNRDQDDNELETSEIQFEEYALKLNASNFASRSKAKAKPQRRDSASSSTRTIITIGERILTFWTTNIFALRLSSVEETDQSSPSWKSTSRQWWGDWILENKNYLQDHFVFCHRWSDEKWKSSMAGGGHKKIFQYCIDSSGRTVLYLRALQGHSGRNLIDPSLQDNVVIPDGFFKYIYNVGCAINLHSIINSGLIPGGQNLSNRQTVFSLLVDHMDKSHKDPDTIDLEAPRLAQYMHKEWRNIKTRCIGSTSTLLKSKDWSSISHDRTQSFFTKHSKASCIPKVVRMETGGVIYEKVYISPRPPPKISFKHESRMDSISWRKTLEISHNLTAKKSMVDSCEIMFSVDGWFNTIEMKKFFVCGTFLQNKITLIICQKKKTLPVGIVTRQAEGSQPSQPNPNPNHDSTGRPVVCSENTSRSQEIDTRFSRDCKNTNLNVDPNHDRTGDPLCAHSQLVRPHGSTSLTSTSEYLDCHTQLWNKPKILVFVNSWRRSRTTLTNNLFKSIYNKVMPTTHLVKNQRRWLRTWASRAIWVMQDNSKRTMLRMPSFLESRNK